jgi:hypothetical protein
VAVLGRTRADLDTATEKLRSLGAADVLAIQGDVTDIAACERTIAGVIERQRRFHRPRSYLHPQTSSLDHYHRLLAALLRRRRAITSTLLAQLLGVGRTNLSNQFQDGNRLLDLHRVVFTPLPGAPVRTLEQIRARLSDEDHPADQL